MSNKQFFINDISCKFNLRNAKSEVTNVYCIIRIMGKQLKFNMGVKVKTSHWHKQKQEAYISPYLSELDNHNNLIVNQKINAIKRKFDDTILYLCQTPNEIANFENIIKDNFSIMEKREKRENAILLLKIYIDNKTVGERTKRQYYSMLSPFEYFATKKAKEMNVAYLDFVDITLPLLEEYKKALYTDNDYFVKHDITNEMVAITDDTVLQRICNLLIFLREAEKYDKIDVGARKLEKAKFKAKKSDNAVWLNDNEIQLFIEYPPQNEKEENVIDLFIFQCECGQRFEDINGLRAKVQDNKMTIKQQKGKEKVTLSLSSLAINILHKYNYQLPKLNIVTACKTLKQIGEKIGITEEVECLEYRAFSEYKFTAKKYQLLGTHTARRTFVSDKISKGISPTLIMGQTGHKSNAFNRYDRMTSVQKADAYAEAMNKVKATTTTSFVQHNQQSSITNDDAETLRVLQFLGVDTNKYTDAELKNKDFTDRLIAVAEFSLLNEYSLNSKAYQQLKKIFNENLSMTARKDKLKQFLDDINTIGIENIKQLLPPN